jgi:hypothetical protein
LFCFVLVFFLLVSFASFPSSREVQKSFPPLSDPFLKLDQVKKKPKQNKTKNKKTKIKTNKQKGFKPLGRLLHFALMQKMQLLIQFCKLPLFPSSPKEFSTTFRSISKA